MNRAQTGQRGEAAAAKFYLDRGCRLLTHNFHTRMGELDVVVQEPDGTGLSDAPVRFDVAEVKPLDSGRWMVHIIRGAFLA